DVLPWTEDFNALTWWRDSSSRYNTSRNRQTSKHQHHHLTSACFERELLFLFPPEEMSGNNENEASSEEMAKTRSDDDCDHGNSPGDTSDNDSINDCDCDFEQNSALRYLAMLSCTRGVLPVDGGLLSVLLATNDVFKTLNVDYIREESLCMHEVQKVKAKRVLKDLDGKISLSIDIL
ncbi:hypothetical protein Tsubulata_002530, partial [Turnera subulata]